MSLPEFSIRYPVTVLMLTLAVALLGAISLSKLGTDLLPNMHTPVITVDWQVPGKAPQEVEEQYTRRLERDISTISGVDRVYSITRSGQSVVVAEFDWEADMDFALIDVQKKMGVYATDEDIETLDVIQEDPQALPVMRIAVSATGLADLDELLGAVETVVKPKLEALKGVASADIEGGAEKEIRVTLDPYLLEAFGQDANQVIAAITSANEDVSGGTLREAQQSYQVKGLGRLADLEDVRNVIVGARQGEGVEEGLQVPVYVRDVGGWRWSTRNGKPSCGSTESSASAWRSTKRPIAIRYRSSTGCSNPSASSTKTCPSCALQWLKTKRALSRRP